MSKGARKGKEHGKPITEEQEEQQDEREGTGTSQQVSTNCCASDASYKSDSRVVLSKGRVIKARAALLSLDVRSAGIRLACMPSFGTASSTSKTNED